MSSSLGREKERKLPSPWLQNIVARSKLCQLKSSLIWCLWASLCLPPNVNIQNGTLISKYFVALGCHLSCRFLFITEYGVLFFIEVRLQMNSKRFLTVYVAVSYHEYRIDKKRTISAILRLTKDSTRVDCFSTEYNYFLLSFPVGHLRKVYQSRFISDFDVTWCTGTWYQYGVVKNVLAWCQPKRHTSRNRSDLAQCMWQENEKNTVHWPRKWLGSYRCTP